MTPEEHQKRHIELHKKLDELLADFIQHGNGRLSNPILALVEWSHKQTISPDQPV